MLLPVNVSGRDRYIVFILNIYVSVDPTLFLRPRIEFSQQDCLPDNNRAALMMVMVDCGLMTNDHLVEE